MKEAHTAAAARARQPPDPAATLASGRPWPGISGRPWAGIRVRAGPDAAGAGGMSAVTAASSA